MATLDVTSQVDFSSTALSQISTVNLIGFSFVFGWVAASPDFAATQFDNAQIFTNVTFVNTNGAAHSVTVNGSFLDASLWNFQNWLASNRVYINGTAGDDSLTGSIQADVIEGGAGADDLDGGTGTDTLSYALATAGVSVNLLTNAASKGDAQGDTIVNFENITSGKGNDILTGNDVANALLGGAGNDTMQGRGGGDTLDGDIGIDILSYSASVAGVTINLALLTAAGGDAEGDIFAGFENVTGGLGADALTGDGANNVLRGGTANDNLRGGLGNDTLYGGTENDALTGGDGNDRLLGEDGSDKLTGGAGVDTLTGAAGKDSFLFVAISDSGIGLLRDIIADFQQGLDKINLSKIDAIVGGANDAFTFYGQVPPQGVDGELRFHFTPTHTVISGDTDGDGTANFQIGLLGNIALQATDFVL